MKRKNEYLITGGSGSLGNVLTELILKSKNYKGIRIYSRSEFLQWEMKQKFKGIKKISYILGDVRDKDRLMMAMHGVDIVINAAAQKHVTASEENPIEAMKTNCLGAANVVECAIANQVKKVMHIGSDKEVYPVNLYGATKAVAEKLILHSSIYDPRGVKFACCRYGNVIGSRGSIVPLFRDQSRSGVITITDERMTRFFITLPKVAKFILNRINTMKGGEIFIPKMPSMKIIDAAKVIAPRSKVMLIGIQPGEKLAESLITYEESNNCKIFRDYYEINHRYYKPIRFSYNSQDNKHVLKSFEFKRMIDEYEGF
jgi:FlaA1/EpsC-like NDP-sugar epimerase